MRNTQCAVQAINNMVFNVEKRVFLVERYLKTESFTTTQSDYIHSTSKICDMEISETVQADRKCEHPETCSPFDCC
jgi:hypothetical protein